jgi:hypothetical protein
MIRCRDLVSSSLPPPPSSDVWSPRVRNPRVTHADDGLAPTRAGETRARDLGIDRVGHGRARQYRSARRFGPGAEHDRVPKLATRHSCHARYAFVFAQCLMSGMISNGRQPGSSRASRMAANRRLRLHMTRRTTATGDYPRPLRLPENFRPATLPPRRVLPDSVRHPGSGTREDR